ncbi:spore protease YyaC [Tumebacillus permanentifrigoris]|uniref:Putative sporulation protein YyaC n=1 Tax=Tumebacillus permanentifrigoris TaxID=378543 RepID=A0A316DF74_9BACL|nr:spore protease YyaC [Tumebacillus permanentifrigoris]PWK16595.1 putative sporulation protein YyaC [Tumebacillus permanentifrigoris]
MLRENNAKTSGAPFKVDHNEPRAAQSLAERLFSYVQEHGPARQVVIVCIGTDRSTGDALGPLVGSKLSARVDDHPFVTVYGTLESPVHAVNLKDTIQEIQGRYTNPFVIAVDACLGQIQSVGLVTIGNGPLKPGAGVNKVLPEVGNIHVTGIVNVGGFMEYFVLQNTRLSIVMRMADCIADGLHQAVTHAFAVPHPVVVDELSNSHLDAKTNKGTVKSLFPFL